MNLQGSRVTASKLFLIIDLHARLRGVGRGGGGGGGGGGGSKGFRSPPVKFRHLQAGS